jgi:hypothetical protein
MADVQGGALAFFIIANHSAYGKILRLEVTAKVKTIF